MLLTQEEIAALRSQGRERRMPRGLGTETPRVTRGLRRAPKRDALRLGTRTHPTCRVGKIFEGRHHNQLKPKELYLAQDAKIAKV